jgi:quinolinate synthase
VTTAVTRNVPRSSGIELRPDMEICQTDLPLDWYQDEFKSYAEEYLRLPDRLPGTVLPWMDGYIRPALEHFGPSLMLLAHYYMGGEIVKLVERYGGRIADSYELALQTRHHPEVKLFVESAVHFMAEAIAILAADDQTVWITNPKAGCTMEMMAKDFQVQPIFDRLRARYGDDLLVIAYMNTSGRIKALAGGSGGSVCTSSNAEKIVRWALAQNRKIFFVPDRHLGDNVAAASGLAADEVFHWGGGADGAGQSFASMTAAERDRCDRARMVVWGSYCGVHTIFRPDHVEYWRGRGYRVLVHPECTKPVVDAADGSGSTKYLWGEVMNAGAGSKLAIATEGHFVRNATEQGRLRGIDVVNVADVPGDPFATMGCGCATMSRNDPPHLVATLDLLRQGKAPEINRVLPGDVVDERSGARNRLSDAQRAGLVTSARAALERMIAITSR